MSAISHAHGPPRPARARPAFRHDAPGRNYDMELSFQSVTKNFGSLPVIHDLDFELAPGGFLALVGPSGCGKSTILHLAAGLERPSSGLITAGEAPVTGPNPERTLVFQEHALYPWLTLEQNVAMARELQGVSRKAARAEARDWLARVRLEGFESYYPHKVSGGMRQRAALARAFVARPRLLLLDEPFGALDALTRLELQDVLLDLVGEQELSAVLVTHDVDEALYLSDRVMVFSPRPARVLADIPLKPKVHSRDPERFARERKDILKLLGVQSAPQASAPRQEAPQSPTKELQHA
ncbi:MAG TPA: ABC transporter ATP-binding protein [Trueperaceae bacterium]